jgi:hypothetical protein
MNDKPSLARRVLSGCVPLFVLAVGLALVVYRILPSAIGPGLRALASVASALFLTLGLSSFWSLTRGFGRGEKSRHALLRRARTGETPEDGEPILASGSVRSLSSPLAAPLSGTECAAYMYRMFYWARDSRGRRQSVPVYWGFASQPFTIDGGSSRRTVVAMPRISQQAEERRGAAAVDRARSIVRSTQFEPVNQLATAGTALAAVNEMLTDEDGFTSRHWKRSGDERDPAQLTLEETLLPVGATASVLGTWSATRGAIVADLGSSGSAGVIAMTGPPEELLGSSGPHSFTSYLVTSTVFTLIGLGIVWFAIRVLPGLQ